MHSIWLDKQRFLYGEDSRGCVNYIQILKKAAINYTPKISTIYLSYDICWKNHDSKITKSFNLGLVYNPSFRLDLKNRN